MVIGFQLENGLRKELKILPTIFQLAFILKNPPNHFSVSVHFEKSQDYYGGGKARADAGLVGGTPLLRMSLSLKRHVSS